MNRAQLLDPETLDADLAPEGGAVPGDGLEEEVLEELSLMRAIMLRFARRIDARADTPEGQKELPRLTNAVTRAMRALRQIQVLQLEVAGKRPVAVRRGPAANGAGDAAANANRSAGAKDPKRFGHNGYPFENGDYDDYDDYTDQERKLLGRAIFRDRVKRMRAAMKEDFEAAGRPHFCREAPVKQFELITSIPHPALDRCLPGIEREIVFLIFGEDNVKLSLGPGPPGVLEKFDELCRKYPPSKPA
jgi:hypothetical protein